jgi:glyoxylase-like metal-dependent hydrolase (beta-lactamase superfamily II)
MPTLDLGRISVDVIPCGEFRLDGGAMFGQVPKVRWQTFVPADASNRIVMGTNALLVRGPSFVLVVETGCGTRWTDQELGFFGISSPRGLLDGLARLGVRPEDVTHVTCSHLHFDHGGGLLTGDGGTPADEGDLTFPNAEHLLNEAEYAAALSPPEFQKASYRGPFARIGESGRLRPMRGEADVLPGVRIRHTGGHTDGHQVVLLGEGREKAVFLGDLVPTAWHLPPAYTMAYDLHPQQVMTRKREVLEDAAAGGWIACFYHDPDARPARVKKDGRRFAAERLGAA